MKQENIILEKSFSFAVRIVKLYKYLYEDKKEFVLSKQLLRCGTSIGAQAGQSKNDFIAKMSIASKESRETKYWTDLLVATKYLNIADKHAQSLVNDIEKIIKRLTSIIKSTQANK